MATGKEKTISLNKTQLSTLLRISNPFLMIDKVTNIIPSFSGRGSKHINKDEWFYKCHFTDEPIMPGALQIEAMLQTIVAIIYSDTKWINKFKYTIACFFVIKINVCFPLNCAPVVFCNKSINS